MKKIISTILAVTIAVSLTACGSLNNESENGAASGAVEQKQGASWEVAEAKVKMWKDSIGSSWVQVIIPVVNNGGENLYLKSGSVDLEDASGKLVKSLDLVNAKPDIIMPGETGYYYESTTLDGVDVQELKAIPHFEIKESKNEVKRLDVSEISITDKTIADVATIGIEISGRVENKDSEPAKMVYVVANLFDADKNIIGQAFTIMTDDIAAGDKVGFTMSGLTLPDEITASSVASYEVYAYPYEMQF